MQQLKGPVHRHRTFLYGDKRDKLQLKGFALQRLFKQACIAVQGRKDGRCSFDVMIDGIVFFKGKVTHRNVVGLNHFFNGFAAPLQCDPWKIQNGKVNMPHRTDKFGKIGRVQSTVAGVKDAVSTVIEYETIMGNVGILSSFVYKLHAMQGGIIAYGYTVHIV